MMEESVWEFGGRLPGCPFVFGDWLDNELPAFLVSLTVHRPLTR